MKQLTQSHAWISLEKHAEAQRLSTVQDLKHSISRQALFNITNADIHLDFTNQRITSTTLELLIDLANECDLQEKINSLFCGANVNASEQCPALHTALRALDTSSILVNGKDIIPDIVITREKMRMMSEQIRTGQWFGFSGKQITDIVNIGIGGSDLGPRFCVHALANYTAPSLSYHFISDSDPNSFKDTVASLHPETTLFIISSKSFTTQETLYNAKKAMSWIGNPQHLDKHFIAVTANVQRAQQHGLNNVLPIWSWVGGRFSLSSAINLITCIAIGYDAFSELLAGARTMDQHFQTRSFHENMPVLLALIGLWNINFLHISNLLLLAYTKQLELFIPYVQQLDMESNGKSFDQFGGAVNYATGPIVWGGLGNQAQHSYYQLLCQGTHKVATDFISTRDFNKDMINTLCEAKIRVLSEGSNSPNNAGGYIPGGMPINHISLSSVSPHSIGALIALYEHKTYAQGVLWNINSFDQPGVESAKQLSVLEIV